MRNIFRKLAPKERVLVWTAAVALVVFIFAPGDDGAGIVAEVQRASALDTIRALGVGAAVGAGIGAYLGHWLRETAEKERANRERDGLLRLVSLEISQHKVFGLSPYLTRKPGQFVEDSDKLPLGTDVWEQVRTKIVQWLPPNEFSSLGEYYSNVLWFNYLLENNTKQHEDVNIHLSGLAHSLANVDGPKIREWMRDEYIGLMPPTW